MFTDRVAALIAWMLVFALMILSRTAPLGRLRASSTRYGAAASGGLRSLTRSSTRTECRPSDQGRFLGLSRYVGRRPCGLSLPRVRCSRPDVAPTHRLTHEASQKMIAAGVAKANALGCKV